MFCRTFQVLKQALIYFRRKKCAECGGEFVVLVSKLRRYISKKHAKIMVNITGEEIDIITS